MRMDEDEDEACHRTKCMVYCQSLQVNVSHSLEALSIKKENTLTSHKKLSSIFCRSKSEVNLMCKEGNTQITTWIS